MPVPSFIVLLLLAIVAARPVAHADSRADPQRLLVTVALEDGSLDAGALRDFRRPARYGGGPRTERLLDALANEHGLLREQGWAIHALSVYCAVFRLPPSAAAAPLLARLEADPRVDSAQPLLLHHTRAAADYDDPLLPLQDAFARLQLAEAHALSRGAGTSVAVIDAGLDARHPELRGRIARQADFTDGRRAGQHGTAVAGLIAARPGNGLGIVGIAPEARLLDLRACWPTGDGGLQSACSSLSLARALDAAVSSGATVVTLALSGPDDPLVSRLIAVASARGASVVAAAGGPDAFPASHPDVLPAAGLDAAAAQAVRVPASGLLTTFPGGGFDYVSGNSFAVAQVAGIVALLRARHPRLTPERVRSRLLSQQPLDVPALLAPTRATLASAH